VLRSVILRYVFICFECFSRDLRGLEGIVRGALRVCRVALPLVMLSRLKFSLVLRFRAFVGVLVRVARLNAITGVF
jgi:hypothetical protein